MEDKGRVVEIYTMDGWLEIAFEELRPGNRFRLFDDEVQVMDRLGYREWMAINLPYINRDGVYEVQCSYGSDDECQSEKVEFCVCLNCIRSRQA